MLVQRTDDKTVVKFSTTEAKEIGLPRACYVSYDQKGRLDDWSHWLEKQPSFERKLDVLIAQADAALATIH